MKVQAKAPERIELQRCIDGKVTGSISIGLVRSQRRQDRFLYFIPFKGIFRQRSYLPGNTNCGRQAFDQEEIASRFLHKNFEPSPQSGCLLIVGIVFVHRASLLWGLDSMTSETSPRFIAYISSRGSSMVFLKTTLAVFFLQAVTTPPAQPPRTASIEGSVVGTSGERLSKVSVTLTLNSDPSTPGGTGPRPADLPPELAQILLQSQINLQAQNSIATTVQLATTDADGKFVFDNLRAGSYRLDAARSGYVSTKYGQKGANGREMPVVLAAGQKLKDIQIAMMPAGAISGRIVDRNGEPISRVGVQAWRYRYSERGRTLALVQSVTTNDLGEYRLFWLAPGSYVVSATPPPPALAPSTTMPSPLNANLTGTLSVVFQGDVLSTAMQGPSS